MLDQLLRNQALSRDQLLRKQQEDLTAILDHAVRECPYYREKYRGLDTRLEATDTLSALPVLHKDDVRAQRDALVAESADRRSLKLGHTGGSTGIPLAFYYDRHKMELMRAGMCRSYMWSGWRPGQRILNFWGARQDIKTGGLRKRFDDWIAAEQTIAAYEYTEADLARWVQQIRRYRPVLLQGYASILAELARYVRDEGLRLPTGLRGVYATAEVLYDWQRTLIESAFGCKVFNQYGSREIPNIACECPAGNQHVFTDMVYLESVPMDGEDRLIITSLTNRVMPFIRYAIGDTGRLKDGECACGSPFPLMEIGVCRSNDLIRTGGGKVVYPSYFIHLLDGLESVQQYQFVQTATNRMQLNIVSAAPLATEIQAQLQARIAHDVDPAMVLNIGRVEAIARTRSGKRRFVISDIA